MRSTLDVVDGVIATHNERDVQALASWYAPGATVDMDGWPEPIDVPTWLAGFDQIRESFPDLTLSRRTVASGDHVVMAEIRMSGTNSGPLHLGAVDRLILRTDAETLPPTGKAMDVVGVVVLDVSDDGKVTAERHHWSATDVLVQLGLVTLGARGTTDE